MSSCSPKFRKLNPLPSYDGPRTHVYRCTFPWASSVDCFVRRIGNQWQTAPIPDSGLLAHAVFSPCPVAGASMRRDAAVMAFDHYHHKGAR